MRLIVLLALPLLAGCAATVSDRYEPPVVDMRGVDQQKWANDQAECIDRKRNADTWYTAFMITKCMEAKGYRILAAKG
jgi:hypothetical protein